MSDRQDMTCWNCAFLLQFGPDEEERGECHRLPPQVVLDTATHGRDVEGDQWGIYHTKTVWPVVTGAQWCGEWRAK